jgi:hypothetical protein
VTDIDLSDNRSIEAEAVHRTGEIVWCYRAGARQHDRNIRTIERSTVSKERLSIFDPRSSGSFRRSARGF